MTMSITSLDSSTEASSPLINESGRKPNSGVLDSFQIKVNGSDTQEPQCNSARVDQSRRSFLKKQNSLNAIITELKVEVRKSLDRQLSNPMADKVFREELEVDHRGSLDSALYKESNAEEFSLFSPKKKLSVEIDYKNELDHGNVELIESPYINRKRKSGRAFTYKEYAEDATRASQMVNLRDKLSNVKVLKMIMVEYDMLLNYSHSILAYNQVTKAMGSIYKEASDQINYWLAKFGKNHKGPTIKTFKEIALNLRKMFKVTRPLHTFT